jgi:hypothetical protein
MDVSDASYYIQENNENKGSQMGHTKKIFKKKTNNGLFRENVTTYKSTNLISRLKCVLLFFVKNIHLSKVHFHQNLILSKSYKAYLQFLQ